jgi:hypothetical protein
MGTDLVGWVELYNPFREMWSNVIRIDALDNRNYRLYEKVFGFKVHQGNVGEMTLHAGYSPTDARFSDATIATPPRRLRPRRSLFFAALWSRCRLVQHSGRRRHRMDTPYGDD